MFIIATVIFHTAFYHQVFSRSVFIKEPDTVKPIAEREMIVVLLGLGGGASERRSIKRFLKNKGYDIYIPDYISRKSVEESVLNLKENFDEINVYEYGKIHIFAYILGSWTINLYLQKYELNNLCTIIYDRSPLQERAPYLVSENIPFITRILMGRIVKDLSQIEYPPLTKKDIKVGLIIENRATGILRIFKKKAIAMGPMYWEVDSLHERYDDFFYTWLNHNQMYDKIDNIDDEIFYFLEHDSFSQKARKEVYEGDPFLKYTEE
jgi:hypothetical protein